MKSNEVIALSLGLIFGIPMIIYSARFLILDILFYRRCGWDFLKVPPWGRNYRFRDEAPSWTQEDIRGPLPKGKERLSIWFFMLVIGLFFTVYQFTEYDFLIYLRSLLSLSKSAILSVL